MSNRKLRAVAPDETAPVKVMPATMAAAADEDRITMLRRARLTLLQTLDSGPPAHAAARLMTEMLRIDAEVRLLELAAAKEIADGNVAADAAFNVSAV